jgi:hypothetical protein
LLSTCHKGQSNFMMNQLLITQLMGLKVVC